MIVTATVVAAQFPGLPAVVTLAVPRGASGQLGPSVCPFLNLTLSTLIPGNTVPPVITSCITVTPTSGKIGSLTNYTVGPWQPPEAYHN